MNAGGAFSENADKTDLWRHIRNRLRRKPAEYSGEGPPEQGAHVFRADRISPSGFGRIAEDDHPRFGPQRGDKFGHIQAVIAVVTVSHGNCSNPARPWTTEI